MESFCSETQDRYLRAPERTERAKVRSRHARVSGGMFTRAMMDRWVGGGDGLDDGGVSTVRVLVGSC